MYRFYNYVIRLLTASIHLAAGFSSKARLWVDGRKDWRKHLQQALEHHPRDKTLWMHVASLGEFEQGRPIIEAFRVAYPDWRILLTFFSPSGYEVRKDYPLADIVAYLPDDSPDNARDFVAMVRPDVAVFVKYDFWANYLFQLKKRGTPTLLVSALFRPSQPFFAWYGRLWRKMLRCFSHVFVQNQSSAALLQRVGYQQVTVGGDTRVDRVLRLAAEVKDNSIVADFVANSPVFVAGSTWGADESLLAEVLQKPEFQHFKLIIAPHSPSSSNVGRICRQFGQAVRYSAYNSGVDNQCRVMVIDNVGLLNSLYRYGSIAYIGGGFGSGIHNTLEPAAFGLPIIIGPRYEKFEEARQFVARGGAFSVADPEQLTSVLQQLESPEFRQHAAQVVTAFLKENQGATDLAMAWLATRLQQTSSPKTVSRD